MNERHSGKRPGREDFQRALQSTDTFVDVTVDDLMMLSQRAEQFASRRAAEAIDVTRVMSQPVRTVYPMTPLTDAAHLMVSERISGLPVVDEAERLIGIITEADFLRALGVADRPPSQNLWQTLEHLFTHLTHHAELQAPDDPVADHMAKEVVTATPEQDLHEVLELMKRHRVKRVIVIDRERRALGIVTRSDLVRVFFDSYTRRS